MSAFDDYDNSENPYASPDPASFTEPMELDGRTVEPVDPDEVRGVKPFLSIWFSPRITMRKITTVDPRLHVIALVCLAGIADVLNNASSRNAGDVMPLFAILIMALILGPVFGIFRIWIGSHLVRRTGAWIGGYGDIDHIKAALAWGSFPMTMALPLWIPQLILAGSEMFTESTPTMDAQPALMLVLLPLFLLETVLFIWGFVVTCNTVAEVQGYQSAWKGLGNMLLAGLVVMVPIFVLVMLLVVG